MSTPPNQQSLALIPHAYQGELIQQRKANGYIDATSMCKAAGKKWNDYARLSTTAAFIKELSSVAGIPATELIQSVNGGSPDLQGTWVHPQVAIHLAQWASPKFAVRVSEWVVDWMSGLSPTDKVWKQFEDRVSLVYDNVPVGYFWRRLRGGSAETSSYPVRVSLDMMYTHPVVNGENIEYDDVSHGKRRWPKSTGRREPKTS